LPLRDGSVDAAVCTLALTYLPRLEPALAELARVVRPGGTIITSDIHVLSLYLGGVSLPELTSKYGLTLLDLASYFPADYREIERSDIAVHYLGYYIKWTPQEAYYYAVEHTGFQARPFRTERDVQQVQQHRRQDRRPSLLHDAPEVRAGTRVVRRVAGDPEQAPDARRGRGARVPPPSRPATAASIAAATSAFCLAVIAGCTISF